MRATELIDPFTAWSRVASAGFDWQSTWLRSVETLQASHNVIGARTDLMRAAVATPLAGDYAELPLMVPEKVEAFSRSAQAVMRGTMAMHTAWARQMQRVTMLMVAGRMPQVGELTALAEQNVDYALGAVTASARLGKGALAPVHRAATGNARRLKRRAP